MDRWRRMGKCCRNERRRQLRPLRLSSFRENELICSLHSRFKKEGAWQKPGPFFFKFSE